MSVHPPSLELVEVGLDLVAIASNLPNTPPISLQSKTTDEVLQRYSATPRHPRSAADATLQVVLATITPLAPEALSSVAVVWLPRTARANADSLDFLRLAVSLWQPNRPNSPLYRFSSAYSAVLKMSAASSPSSFPSSFPSSSK
jgi:hypothetical protein